MNIFKDRNMYLGEVNSKSLGTDFVELIELTRSIRNKLGCRKYMVDWYVLTLLEIANTFSLSDLVGDGTDAGDRLYTLIIQSMRREKPAAHTRIGDAIDEYIQKHPLPFLEEETRVAVYMADLSDLYLEHAAQRYVEEKEHIVRCQYDHVYIDQQFEAIVGIIGNEEEMIRLNELILTRFMKVKPLEAYLQGYTAAFMDNLTHRDIQTDRTVLQILLDRQES